MDWEAKAMFVLMMILLVGILNYLVGTFLPLSEKKIAEGMLGWSRKSFTIKSVYLLEKTRLYFFFSKGHRSQPVAQVWRGRICRGLRRLLPLGHWHFCRRQHVRRFAQPQ